MVCRVFIENIVKEISVIKLFDMKFVDWFEGMLGYSFCDLSIFLDVFSEIVFYFNDVVKLVN